NKSQADDVAHKYKLAPEMVHRWTASLEKWSKTNDAIFSPWLEFAALPEKEFPAKAKELAAKFSQNTGAAINPLVARAFAGEPPATLKQVAERYGKLFNEMDKH